VDIGISVFGNDQSVAPSSLAREVEDRGFGSLYFSEHTHMPVQHTPHPSGQPLPFEYSRTLDPYVALATAAAVTTRIRLGTSVSLVAQHDPVVLAKQVATLDHLSGGRVVLGVGYGWNKAEADDHGVDWSRRRDRVREHMLAMTALWSEEVASYEGDFVRLPPSWSWPKPVQQPRPTVLVGAAAGARTFSHIVEWADGWMPMGVRTLGENLPTLRCAWADAGRRPEDLRTVVTGSRPTQQRLDQARSLGATEMLLGVPSQGSLDEVRAVLDGHMAYL
jgi:probable F420-dependent oxidoreductase